MEVPYQLMCDSSPAMTNDFLKCHFAEETKGSNTNTSAGVHDTHKEVDWVRVFRFVSFYEQAHLTPHFPQRSYSGSGRSTLKVTSSGGRPSRDPARFLTHLNRPFHVPCT